MLVDLSSALARLSSVLVDLSSMLAKIPSVLVEFFICVA